MWIWGTILQIEKSAFHSAFQSPFLFWKLIQSQVFILPVFHNYDLGIKEEQKKIAGRDAEVKKNQLEK